MGLTQRHRDTEEESAVVTREVIGAAIEVHRTSEPGLLEAVYEELLSHELALRGLAFERQVPVPLRYKGAELAVAFVADLIVANSIVVELKATEKTNPVHERQALTYLRLTGCRFGLLLNFGALRLTDGITPPALTSDGLHSPVDPAGSHAA